MSVAHRLPTDVRPRAYVVDILADPSWESFSGSVRIDLDVLKPVEVIEMHARELDLTKAELDGRPAIIQLDAPSETVRFVAGSSLRRGESQLTVSFRGRPNPGLHGLYIARDGGEVALATQCEATDARAIFPCFDEPAFKATLQWTVHTTADSVALANGRLESVEDDGPGRKVWRFAPTPPISSYLAALTVGPYEALPAVRSNGTPIRVWALAGKATQTRFAQSFTQRLLPWYEDYFGLPYAYGKYDQVAVPGFDAGAMENVGLVLFRQNLLLMDPQSASWNQEKLIAKVIAHELAHMWFGNLVTMGWWDDLWLNEAFAEWFAHKATEAVAPQYQVWNDFQLDKNRALTDDAMDTTHAVWTPVQTPSQALEMFDVITYQKGCAVMRMLETFVGDTPFRAGIRSYMKAFAGRNADGSDLWHHLELASGQPVGQLMRSWVEQPGFPLVTLSLNDRTVALEQARFYSDPDKAETDQQWNIPLELRYEDAGGIRTHRILLTDRLASVELPGRGPVAWVYGNANEVGFYRVHHADETADRLPVERLNATEQMGLLEDQWSLVRNGLLPIDRFLPMVDRFTASQDHNVLRALSDRLATLERLLIDGGDHAVHAVFRRRLAQQFAGHLSALGFTSREGESQDRVQRRAVVLFILGVLAEAPDVVDEAKRQAELEREDARSVDPNLAGTYLNIAARFGDESLYDLWWATYQDRRQAGSPPQDTLRYLYTLTSFREPALTRRTLDRLLDGTVPQEAIGGLLSQLLGSHHGCALAWESLRDNWDRLRPKVGDMGVSRVVEALGRLPSRLRPDIIAFFEQHPPYGAERALTRGLTAMAQYEELRVRATPGLLRVLSAAGG